MPSIADSKRQTLHLRIKPEVRDLMDRTAKVRCKNRTDFIVEMPPQANPKLRKTMHK